MEVICEQSCADRNSVKLGDSRFVLRPELFLLVEHVAFDGHGNVEVLVLNVSMSLVGRTQLLNSFRVNGFLGLQRLVLVQCGDGVPQGMMLCGEGGRGTVGERETRSDHPARGVEENR